MIIFIGFLSLIFFGYLVTRICKPDLPIHENLGLSFLIGIGLFTWVLYLTSAIGLKINLLNSSLVLLLLILVTSLILSKILKIKIFQDPKSPFKIKLEKVESLILFAVVGLLSMSLITSIYWPINIWDAIALYDFRAKVILDTGYFIQIANNFTYFAYYPLLTSIAHVWVYLLGGKNPQFIYSLFFIFFLIVFYGLTRRFASRFTSLGALLLVSSYPIFMNHSTFAYTNLPYAIYIFLGSIYMYLFLKSEERGYLILSAFLIGLSTWTRLFEPFWISNFLILGVYVVVKKRYKFLLLYSLVFFPIFLSWMLYELGLGSAAYSADHVSLSNIKLANIIDLSRMLQVLVFLYKYVFLSWGYNTILFIFVIAANIKNIFKNDTRILLGIFGVNLAVLIGGTYLFSIAYPSWLTIPDSAQRMSIFFIPLMAYFSALSWQKKD